MTFSATDEDMLSLVGQGELVDHAREERFARVVRLAHQIFKVPVVAVNLVDGDSLITHAAVGLPLGPMPLKTSMCRHTLDSDGGLYVPDALHDARFRHHEMVDRLGGIRFYAGHPLHAPNGQTIGALCLIDFTTRQLTSTERQLLRDLGEWVEKEMATDEELNQAGTVQRQLSPRTHVDAPGYDVAGMCMPSRSAGGDFYDWFMTDGGLQVVLADVMGKGLGAALIAAGVRSVLRGASRFNALDEAVTRSAASLQIDLEETATFVTAFAARIDLATGSLDYVDIGHGLAVVFDTDGGYRRLLTGGMPMGAIPGDSWTAGKTVLEPGETLFMVSDGLLDYFPDPWDAVDTAQRACARSRTAEDFLDVVRALARSERHQDDVTAVVVRRVQEST